MDLTNLKLPISNRARFSLQINGTHLAETKKLTLFIGPNNSGKSLLLRGLAANRTLEARNDGFRTTEVSRALSAWQTSASDPLRIHCKNRSDEPFSLKSLLEKNAQNSLSAAYRLNEATHLVTLWLNGHLPANEETNTKLQSVLQSPQVSGQLNQMHELLLYNAPGREVSGNLKKTYVPTLRGLRTIPHVEDLSGNSSNYKHLREERTKHDYFSEVDLDNSFVPEIATGEELYQRVRKLLLSAKSDRNLVRDYEQFLSRNFFEDSEVSLIPEEGKNVLRIRIGEDERPCYELGDGIQQLIIMTYPALLAPPGPRILFIEEPELYLHPGMQRRLMEAFLYDPDFAETYVFAASHSNHMLGLTLEHEEIAVFKLQPEPVVEDEGQRVFHVWPTTIGDHGILHDLGVQNTSVFLSNCTIWVEGITDRLYIRKYLDLYQEQLGDDAPKFDEDVHFSFVEYAGSNLAHWDFVEDDENPEDLINALRLCGVPLVIADLDKDKEAKHEKMKKLLGEQYYVLDCLEIENLLPPETIEEVMQSQSKYSHLKLKNDHQTIPIETTRFGHYLEQAFDSGDTALTPFIEASGSLKSGKKRMFALNACDRLTELPDSAKPLAEHIYAFVKNSNSQESLS